MSHDPNAMVRADWTAPVVPPGFDQLCAFNAGGVIELDFVSHKRRDFASETMEVAVQWPWVEGFRPQGADWEAIGFAYIH